MNRKICQIVDSSGSLPRDFIKQYNINEVPFYFKFQNTDYYKENIDYTKTEFFNYMKEHPDDVPKTATPNPYDWLSIFEEQYDGGAREFIVTTISSKLSGSFQTATSAKKDFEKKYTDVRIEIIDSKICAGGQAALEMWIAQMIDAYNDFEYITHKAYEGVPKLNTLFVVDSLKYMRAGGRIGGASAFVSKIINIKPVCEFKDGEVRVIKPVIGRKRSLRGMVDIAISRITDINNAIIVVQNATSQFDADYMRDYLWDITNKGVQIFSSVLGITVGAHSGPGAIGIGFLEPTP